MQNVGERFRLSVQCYRVCCHYKLHLISSPTRRDYRVKATVHHTRFQSVKAGFKTLIQEVHGFLIGRRPLDCESDHLSIIWFDLHEWGCNSSALHECMVLLNATQHSNCWNVHNSWCLNHCTRVWYLHDLEVNHPSHLRIYNYCLIK